ncbi:MAG TPA: tRNA lysidine(34) synthetase TilS [Tepidisphaeraceae bacterium]|nr:tRNA lysidine(34) synthetase TilS [Tepidisphaeraceae bacterium]
MACIPPGHWAVGVSGGADSVALVSLLRSRAELSLYVVHLDHQTRGQASAEDARFVERLAAQWNLPCRTSLRSQIEAGLKDLPSNASARYRAVRMELFRQAAGAQNLQGVILAHHADDQAETILQRLIRSSAWGGLCGMSAQTTLGGLRVLRPLLNVRRQELRDYLRAIGQDWREDASNQSDDYLRNRLRRWLERTPELHAALLRLADHCRQLRQWVSENALALPEGFEATELTRLPRLLARESARRWLVARGAPAGELSEAVLDRLIEMAADGASPPRQNFPGGLLVGRRSGIISKAAADGR